MKLEAGKYYRTREGQKRWAVGKLPDGNWIVWSEHKGGLFTHRSDGVNRYGLVGSDLIAEWTDPPTIEQLQQENADLREAFQLFRQYAVAHDISVRTGETVTPLSLDLERDRYIQHWLGEVRERRKSEEEV